MPAGQLHRIVCTRHRPAGACPRSRQGHAMSDCEAATRQCASSRWEFGSGAMVLSRNSDGGARKIGNDRIEFRHGPHRGDEHDHRERGLAAQHCGRSRHPHQPFGINAGFTLLAHNKHPSSALLPPDSRRHSQPVATAAGLPGVHDRDERHNSLRKMFSRLARSQSGRQIPRSSGTPPSLLD